ncbi:diacylglycerol kinase family protein [Eilatimonas milleporae]|uniref:Diacylglycerol kinase family enzyme n=1 Tax=Eilatimonas milleporae TaxID=911205 RepID=A0A3M0C6P3_9PROT|nr:diacylglycerol kinase family protein [Eilatimonas milleporae]RMB04902.1 diacylglycerol kinase family enzyme [Eilatimonas milleporae]
MELDQRRLQSGAIVPIVAVLSNPKSTTNVEGIDKVRKVVSDSANVVHFEMDGLDSIDEALSLFAKASPALLVINGGDGTTGLVLSSLLYRNPFSVIPPIAILPGGKTNMTAADLGARGCPEKMLRRLLKIVKEGALQDRMTIRNLIELDIGDGSEAKVGTFFGTAGIVKGIHWCREHAYSKGMPNTLAHIWSLLTLLGAALGVGAQRDLLASAPMTLSPKGEATIDGRYTVVIATTLEKLLFGLRPYGRAGAGGLGFSAVGTGRKTVIKAFAGLLTGAFGAKDIGGVAHGRGDEILIDGSDPVTLDGEMFSPLPGKPMRLKANRSLTFVRL